MQLVHQYLQDAGRHHPDKLALISDGCRLTYSELLERIDALAGMFIVEGLQKGDRVMVLLHNRAECYLACLAVMRAGGIAVPVPYPSVAATIEEIAGECAPFMFVTAKEELTDLAILRDRLTCHFLLLSGASFSRLGSREGLNSVVAPIETGSADRIIQLMDLREDDGAVLLYGSGSNGMQNGVLFSHHNVTRTSDNIVSVTRTDPSTSEFVLVSLTESFGFMRICSLIFAGAKVVLANGSREAAAIAHGIVKEKCNSLSSDPTSLCAFVEGMHAPIKNVGSQLTSVHMGGDTVPFLFKKKKLIHAFPNAGIYMHYGSAGAPCATWIEFRSDNAKLNSIGQPTPRTEISLIDGLGKIVNRDEIGEILVKGDHVMQRYWQRAQLNQHVFFNGQWLRTGDIGYCDKDGYVHFLGRKNEVINSAGLMISPFEVEEAIHEIYPDCEICVVGIPDPSVQVGDIPVLCYWSGGGQTIIPAELLSSLSFRLDKGKIPRIVYRMDDMPRSSNGNGRHELRKRILDGIAPSTQHVG